MMHRREKSDPAVVARKPANKAGQPAAEPAEPRARPREGGGQGPRGMRASTARAGHRAGKACHRRWAAYGKFCRQAPEVGAVCGKAARTDLCGGRSAMSVPTAIMTAE